MKQYWVSKQNFKTAISVSSHRIAFDQEVKDAGLIHVLEAKAVVEELLAAREALYSYCDGKNTPVSTDAIDRIDRFLAEIK